jgi:hypothetical protein
MLPPSSRYVFKREIQRRLTLPLCVKKKLVEVGVLNNFKKIGFSFLVKRRNKPAQGAG